jgi:hypothetical protein
MISSVRRDRLICVTLAVLTLAASGAFHELLHGGAMPVSDQVRVAPR